jgi:nucleoside-diphosphate-sugar epimerase
VSRVVEALRRVGTCSPCEGPFNIGSGTGITVLGLAREVIRMAGSRSLIRVEPARPFEVDRFVADTGRIAGALGWRPPRDPLEALPAVIADRWDDLKDLEGVASVAAAAKSMTSSGARP